ncbi:MAG: hypothetical protein P8J14_10610 [Emcibacteraceae bacterium]|nr:hypothetical protein [Emcibacteraceae bacterium]
MGFDSLVDDYQLESKISPMTLSMYTMYPALTFLFLISICALITKKLSIKQSFMVIGSFLNRAPVTLLLISIIFTYAACLIPGYIAANVREWFVVEYYPFGFIDESTLKYAIPYTFQALNGLLEMILFAIPCATVIYYFKHYYDDLFFDKK